MLKFSIYSSQGDHKFEILEENSFTISVYQELLLIFSTIDYKDKIVHFICTQKMTDDIKTKIQILTKKYESINIKLRKVNAYFASIPNNEFFFVFPETNFSIPQIISFFESIDLLNKGVPFEQLNEKLTKPMEYFHSLFSELIEKYEINVYSPKKKTRYGEKDKKKRICKYCGKKYGETSFREEAHAISEAIGNKNLISTEECDVCNHRFATSIEQDLFDYLKLYRVLYGKKGKKKIPELKFKNGIKITYDNDKAIILDTKGSVEFNKQGANIPLDFPEKVNVMNIYRCLAKFAISVLPWEVVRNLDGTIKWINDIKDNGEVINLSPVASLLSNAYYDQPELVVYIRKNEDYTLPYIYCEIKIGFIVYVYILPFTSKDKIDFSGKIEFDTFWKLNKHYSRFNNWIFNHFNLDQKKDLTINMEITKREDI